MFLHPGIISLVIGSGIVLILVISASVIGLRIINRWDIGSNSEEQLDLERKTYLVSTLVNYSLLFEILSIFLFIYTAEDIHTLLVGAMCATGSLNANPFGVPALYAKVASFFISSSWIAINSLDNRAEDYPLIKTKYKILILASVVIAIEFFLQLQYFIRVNPNVITSCCGVMFSEKGEGIASSLASSPVRLTMASFYSSLAFLTIIGAFACRTRRRFFNVLFSASVLIFFTVSIVSIISFISLYFYQLPTHHCPFDILQKEYYYSGYPLYAALFGGSFFGIMAGIIEFFKKVPSLTGKIPETQRRWIIYSIALLIIFAIIASAPIILLPFKMF